MSLYDNLSLFDVWNEEKKIIHYQKSSFHIYEKEIRYVKLWINVWFEENGKQYFRRPVLVLKKVGNIFFCAALTSKWKDNNRFYHKFKDINLYKHKRYEDSSYIILSQVKVIDKNRFFQKIGIVSPKEFFDIKQKLKELLL